MVVCVGVLVYVWFTEFQNKLQMFPFWCGQEEGGYFLLVRGEREQAGWSETPPTHDTSDTNTYTQAQNKLLSI